MSFTSVFANLTRISHEQSATLWTPLQMDMPSDDDLLPTEHILWDNDRNGPVKMIKRYPTTIPASVRVGAFQRSCQAAILLGYAVNWEAANAEIEEPPTVYSFVQLESATRDLIEALITRSETWSENLNTYALCARCVASRRCGWKYAKTATACSASFSTLSCILPIDQGCLPVIQRQIWK